MVSAAAPRMTFALRFYYGGCGHHKGEIQPTGRRMVQMAQEVGEPASASGSGSGGRR